MTALGRFVLPPDVVIAPVAELPTELRDRIGHDEGDCAVTRPRTRAQSSVVDARTAALLEHFREPSTIVDAVIAFSASSGADPSETLDDAFGVLRGFVDDGVLVTEDSALAAPIATTLQPGDRVGAFELLEPVHVIADTEVHLGRAPDGSHPALKLVRPGARRWVHEALAREAHALGRLDGRVTPRLLEAGELDGQPFLAIAWCEGVDVERAANDARALGADGRAPLLELTGRLAAAYAQLHEQRMLHGDVHARNAVAGPGGAVTLIDFGLAHDLRSALGDEAHATLRGGVDFFLEPEAARARLAGARIAPSATGEQYALGALLYLLLTGAHTRAFSLEPEAMLRQIVEQPPLPFAGHGVTDLPATERVVLRALAGDPAERWSSTAELAHALRTAAADDRTPTPSRRAAPSAGARAGAAMLDATLARLAAPGPLFEEGVPAPTASAMNGAAGFAHALVRIAALREDPQLLASADLWAMRALEALGSHAAFYSEELEIVPAIFGERSFYHHTPGVHAVHATVALARGDEPTAAHALRSFTAAAASEPCEQLDVTFGRAGLLLGCAGTLEALPATLDGAALRAAGDRIRDDLWRALADQPPLAERPPLATLGAAHGWAGFLFALLRWAEASATPPPDGLAARLDQLAALAVPAGRGARWPYEAGGPPAVGGLVASWCNGTAGYVELWALAHRHTGEERFARLAQQAAWTTWEQAADAVGDLCCGFGGRAYALLSMHRHSGERLWRTRACRLAEHAAVRIANGSLRRDSLYKGAVGVALLIAELDAPEPAGMPLFARDTFG